MSRQCRDNTILIVLYLTYSTVDLFSGSGVAVMGESISSSSLSVIIKYNYSKNHVRDLNN